jgi:hypothetical protein
MPTLRQIFYKFREMTVREFSIAVSSFCFGMIGGMIVALLLL